MTKKKEDASGEVEVQRWLFIVARNFGDALINRRLIEAVAASFPGDQIDVLTRPSFQDFFRGRLGVGAVHTASFPMGTVKEFGVGPAWHLWRSSLRFRRMKYHFAVNTTGDLREAFLGWLIGARENAGPVWPASHPAGRLFRPRGAELFMQRPLRIPETAVNIYAAHDEMAKQLGCPAEIVEHLARVRPARPSFDKNRIGLHPFTTLECKFWSWAAWIELCEQLLAEGWRVRIFCSLKEMPVVTSHLSAIVSRSGVELVAGNLDNFFLHLREVAVVVGLDSFAMHAAYALGVPAVLVNGANDPRVWAPPGVRVLSNEGHCARHPCHAHPTCGDGVVLPYICIRGISPRSVLDEVRDLMNADGRAHPRKSAT